MAKEIQAPHFIPFDKFSRPFLFLSGSIEMGVAEEWQKRVVRELKESKWTILNPRRDDWDSSWKQNLEDERFVEQVSWELDALEKADAVLIYFDPTTKSPITLFELGLIIDPLSTKITKEIVVICPDGFWRKGNIDIVCKRYSKKVKQFNSLTDAIRYFRTEI